MEHWQFSYSGRATEPKIHWSTGTEVYFKQIPCIKFIQSPENSNVHPLLHITIQHSLQLFYTETFSLVEKIKTKIINSNFKKYILKYISWSNKPHMKEINEYIYIIKLFTWSQQCLQQCLSSKFPASVLI